MEAYETKHPSCIWANVQTSGGNVMIWGCFGWFSEHKESFLHMDRPPQSPGLNPIKIPLGCAEEDFIELINFLINNTRSWAKMYQLILI